MLKLKIFKNINPNILLLGMGSLLNDISSEMIMPILPMLITSMGGTGLIIGLVGGLRDCISSLLKVFSGYWSDKSGKRKIFIYSGYLTSIVFKLFLAFAQTWCHVLALVGLERVGKGLRTSARDAIISDAMPEEKGKGFGIHRALDTTGAILGGILVFILFFFLKFDFKLIILISAGIAIFSLIPVYFVKEGKRKKQDITLKIGLKNLSKPLKLFILISSMFALANFSYMFFILKAQTSFDGILSIGIPIALFILFNIFYAIFAIPFGILSDKIGRKKVIIFGYALFSLTSFGFAFFNSLIAFLILFALYGISAALMNGNQLAFIADLAPKELKATALGTFHTAVGLMALPASIIAGLLWQTVGFNATFIYGGIMGLIPISLFFIFRNSFKEINQNASIE